MQEEYGNYYKQVDKENIGDNTIVLKQISCTVTVEAHDAKIGKSHNHNRYIGCCKLDTVKEILEAGIKINKTTYHQRQEICDEHIIIFILIDKLYISKDQNHIKHSNKSNGCHFISVNSL